MNDIFDYDEYDVPKKNNVLLDTNNSKDNKTDKTNKTKSSKTKKVKKTNANKNSDNLNPEDKKNLIISIILIIVLVGLVVAIVFYTKSVKKNNNNTPNSGNNSNPNTEIKNNTEEEKKVSIIDVDSNTRPYAVMINCHNAALPQAGLNNAYIVYELMVEGGITRMMALFKDKDVDKIGSVRSARTQYLDYVYENDAIYAHAGGAADADRRLANENINHVDVDGAYGIRDKSLNRAWEHKLFTTTNLIKKGATAKGYRLTTDTKSLLKYTAKEIDMTKYNSSVANNISIKYSDYRTSNYTYDSSSKTYLRSMNSTKNTDLVTGEQYKVKNILVYAVNYSSYCDHGYCLYQKIDNVGTGEGLYITDGYSVPIIWEKPSKNAKTTYKLKETGKELELNDGNTYIQIYPTSGKLAIN